MILILMLELVCVENRLRKGAHLRTIFVIKPVAYSTAVLINFSDCHNGTTTLHLDGIARVEFRHLFLLSVQSEEQKYPRIM